MKVRHCAISTGGNEPGGIRARHIEADNVVSGVQIQGGDAQTASSLIQLAQSIRQGKISAEEIRARNLVSGLQYIADPEQATVDDLRRELNALRAQLEQAVASQEFSDPADAQDATDSLAAAAKISRKKARV
jgi:hypothetical protein